MCVCLCVVSLLFVDILFILLIAGQGQTNNQGILTRDFMSGGFTWTGWDYKGEPTPDGWPDINSHFGILDEAGFPKDRFYWYQVRSADYY